MKVSKEQTLGIIRHIFTFAGGLLIMKGVADEAIVSEIIGATLTLIGGIWSIVEKSKPVKEE